MPIAIIKGKEKKVGNCRWSSFFYYRQSEWFWFPDKIIFQSVYIYVNNVNLWEWREFRISVSGQLLPPFKKRILQIVFKFRKSKRKKLTLSKLNCQIDSCNWDKSFSSHSRRFQNLNREGISMGIWARFVYTSKLIYGSNLHSVFR